MSAAKAVQSEPTVGSVLDEEVVVVRTEEGEEEDLPPVLHKAWEASRVRALNEVLGIELQPEELLVVAVEAPWKGESDEVSSGEEVEGLVSLQPGGPAPKRLRDENRGLSGRGKQRKKRGQQRGAGKKEQGRGRWSMPGFSADPGSAMMVAGSYVVRAVISTRGSSNL